MRMLFQNESIQKQIKDILIEYGCAFIVTDHWEELLTFLMDDKKVFGDVSMFLANEFFVDGDDLVNITMRLLELCNQHISELGDFFRIKTTEEIEKEEQEEVESEKSIKSVKPENEYTGAKGLKMLDESPHGRLHPPLPRNDVVRQAHHDNTAQFYFSPEDEEEIKNIQRLASSGQGLGKDAMDKIYDRVAEEVVRKVGMYQ